jgi:uncharacterized protein (TIGR00725 family)
MGSGSQEHSERAEPLGEWLATEGVHLLTGGGGGVMEAVSRAFHEVQGRAGCVIGILPAAHAREGPPRPGRGYPNPWVEIPIYTHLPETGRQGTHPLSRNHINVLSSDVVIALPGSAGTASEISLALRYGRPVVAYLSRRSDIPSLPQAVPVEGQLEGVQRFVRARLARRES